VLEETPSGVGTTHSTHGILIQELESGCATEVSKTYLPKTRKRSTSICERQLPPCYTKSRVEPLLSVPSNVELSTESESESLTNECMPVVWSVCRAQLNTDCTVPKWSGWLSLTAPTAAAPVERSVVAFMSPILHPITERSTVQECLRQSVEVSKRLQQPYTFVTMDLAAAKIAYDLQWSSAERFSSVIIHLPYILAYKSPPKNQVRMLSKIIDPRISRRWLFRTCTGCKLR